MLSSPNLRIGLTITSLALSACAVLDSAAAEPAAPHAVYGAAPCTRTPKPEDVAAAKGAHKAATRFYERGAWDDAIRCWADAYNFDCTAHDLLVNIANALEKKGDRAGALATLEAYLKLKPNPEIAERVRKLRETLGTPPP
jgi:tetratricopeptide (TPR) repeat protein